METIKKLFGEYLKTVGKGKFIFLVFGAFLMSSLTILEPLFFAQLISYLENFLKGGIFQGNEFLIILGLWIVFTIIYIGFSYIYGFYITIKSANANYERVFATKIENVLKMGYGEYLGRKTGSIYKNFDRGAEVQFHFWYFFFNDLLRSCLNIVLIFIVLLFVDWRMTLISLSLVPFMIAFGIFFNRRTVKKQDTVNDGWDKIFGLIGDVMGNFLLSKTLFLENKFQKKLSLGVSDMTEKQVEISKSWTILNIYTVCLVNISRILVLSFGTYFVLGETLEFYQLFLFYSYINYVFFPLGFVFGSLERVQKYIADAKKFYSEFDNVEKETLEVGKTIKNLQGNIDFKNVEFAYTPEKHIFTDLSFSIKKGETVAFVGNTGAGKSTIVNLILRLWDIKKGEILLDNENIKNISKESLRKHIGIVTQEVGLFNDTLKQNLLYAKPDATDEDLKNALKNAQAHFVENLADGLETVIGERGMKLSGGEKQRIAIARLFLKNPEILILDEATSALDNKTEVLVQTALETLMQGKTSIVIAHRLSTIQNADKIFLLENGKIVETGNYDELMKKGEKFAELASPKHLVIG